MGGEWEESVEMGKRMEMIGFVFGRFSFSFMASVRETTPSPPLMSFYTVAVVLSTLIG